MVRLTSEPGARATIICLIVASFATNGVYGQEATSGLPIGWKRSVTVPAVEHQGKTTIRESALTLWVDQGWMMVRRATADGELEWQIVMAYASDPAEPDVKIEPTNGGLQVEYRKFFVRESHPIEGANSVYAPVPFRVFREKKNAESPKWPLLELPKSHIKARGFGVIARKSDSWIFCESGARGCPPDVWVRLHHEIIRDPIQISKGAFIGESTTLSDGIGTTVDGVGGFHFGIRRFQDEGDLLLVSRASFDTINRILQKRVLVEELGSKVPPVLAPGAWLTDAQPIELEKLKGKVVLLNFWSTRRGVSVRQLPRVQSLYKKFGSEGLVVIGIHSADDDGSIKETIREQGVTFPVMIDSTPSDVARRDETAPLIGVTATRYATSFMPNYFLIDKAGAVVWGFSIDPPAERLIEEVLKSH